MRTLALLAVLACLAPGEVTTQSCRGFHTGEGAFTTLLVTADGVSLLAAWKAGREEVIPGSGVARIAVEVDHFVLTRPGLRPVTVALVPPVKATAPNEDFDCIVARYAKIWCKTAAEWLATREPERLARTDT